MIWVIALLILVAAILGLIAWRVRTFGIAILNQLLLLRREQAQGLGVEIDDAGTFAANGHLKEIRQRLNEVSRR